MSEKLNFDELIRNSEVPVLVDVYSDTCGPCHAMKPVLAELKDRFGDSLRIVKINGPQNLRFMVTHQIEAFPTLILYHKGQVAFRQLGYTPAQQLERMIKGSIAA